jgi:hypothetical protein
VILRFYVTHFLYKAHGCAESGLVGIFSFLSRLLLKAYGKAQVGVKSLEKLELVKKGKFHYKTPLGINLLDENRYITLFLR